MKPAMMNVPPGRNRAVTTNSSKKAVKLEDNSPDKKLDGLPKSSERDVVGVMGGMGMTTSKISGIGGGNSGPGNVNVVCRFRPLNEKEKNISSDLCCDFVDPTRVTIKSQGENNNYKFSFDRIFDPNQNQQSVYEYAAKPIIESVLEGFNGTILAYGQTASGKTHTMQGVIGNLELEGIIPRMIRHIFNFILSSSADLEYTVKVSMVEIYQERIKDLIDVGRTNLHVREDKAKGIYIEDLSEHYVASEDEVMDIMKIGSDNRSIGATNMNEHSSRSHSIFIMTIHQNNVKDLSAKTGKLYLVDLAGSEKISKTGATGLTLEEAKTINKSLTTLGMVINSLTDGKSSHVPYRESKLTRVLQESLGGNSKTCLIITCSPSIYNESETLSTLRFGLRAKNIKNKPKINKEVTVAELKLEIERLERMLNIANKRIYQLETYIRNNNLPVPSEDEIIKEIEKEENENIEPEADEAIEEEDIEGKEGMDNLTTQQGKKQVLIYKAENEDENVRRTMGIGLLTEQLKQERDFNKYQDKKIRELNNKLGNLENDKMNLNDKLTEAMKSLSGMNIEGCEELLSQLNDIKVHYTEAEKFFTGKIEELEKALVDERSRKSIANVIRQTMRTKENEKEKEKEKDLTKMNNNANADIDHEKEEVMSNNSVRRTIHNNEGEEHLFPANEEKNLLKCQNMIKEFIDRLEHTVKSSSEAANLVTEFKNKLNEFQFNQEEEYINLPEEPIEDPKLQFEALFEEEKKKHENEKKIILKALEDKSEKLGQFEVENKDLQEKMKTFESKLSADEKPNMKKLMTLEKNLEQLNKMFQHAMAQKSLLVLDKETLENKIKKRNAAINLLEKELNEYKDQLKVQSDKLSFIQRGTLGRTLTNNVVRIIKGGHLKQNAQIVNGELNVNTNPSTD